MAEMSETSSDAESSCGWTIISNEGSDIETLGSEVTVDYGVEPLQHPHVEEAELQEAQVCSLEAACVEGKTTASLDDTLGEPNLDETLHASEAGDSGGGKEHVLSFSDHSDIVTLGDLKDEEHAEVEAEASVTEESYLGTSSSSQYAFTAAESVFAVQPPAAPNSSSSEDEAGQSAGTAVRRRRLRKNTTGTTSDPEEEAMMESHLSDEEEEEEEEEEFREEEQQQEELTEVRPAGVHVRRQWRSIFITCLLLGLLVALCMGFSHFYGKMFHEDPQKLKFTCGGDGSFLFHEDPFTCDHDDSSAFEGKSSDIVELDDTGVIYQLREQIEKLKTENLNLVVRKMQIQTERDNLQMSLKLETEERSSIVSEQQRLSSENQQLKSSLAREEKSLATLQEELRNLRSQLRDLEVIGSGTDSLLLENQRLKEELEEEKQLIRDFHGKRGDMMAEAQTLRKKLEKESKVTDELRREMSRLKSRASGAGKEVSAEKEELQSRVKELEKKLNFEQQRSDLWEKLYVETKEDQAKGDTESTVKKPKRGVTGKMKDTFDAVKNSTKEFVHHHKEQIKKAKEAVKENLRKFSDSVKSTFRHFKDSASSFMDKARGFYDKKRDERNPRESWQQRSHKHHHKHKSESFQGSRNTRKSGGKVHEHRGQNNPKPDVKGCSGVYDCAYQESMSLFNKAMEPIRADEFHQLLQSYLQQEAVYFRHWKELETFINNFFHNGVFIHDQMLFTDFVRSVGDYLVDLHKYNSLSDDVFGDLDDYIYRHFFGEAYVNSFGPKRPFDKPLADSKEEARAKHHQRKQQRARSRVHSERKWSRSERNADRHMADVKIELGPMPFDPKY